MNYKVNASIESPASTKEEYFIGRGSRQENICKVSHMWIGHNKKQRHTEQERWGDYKLLGCTNFIKQVGNGFCFSYYSIALKGHHDQGNSNEIKHVTVVLLTV